MQESSDLLLHKQELIDLTGKKQPARMIDWLERNNWLYEMPDRKGDIPRVARVYFVARMTGAQLPGRRQRPRLDFMVKQ